MGNIKALAYWNLCDFASKKVLEAERPIKANPVPTLGMLIIGTPGKPNGIIQDYKYKGAKDNIPCYDVFI